MLLTSTNTRSKVPIVGIAALTGALLAGCSSSSETVEMHVDRPSYDSVYALTSVSEYAVIGKVEGARSDRLDPITDPDDPAYPYRDDYEPTKEELSQASVPVIKYSVVITDPLDSSRSIGDLVDVVMPGGTHDGVRYDVQDSVTLENGSTYLFMVGYEHGDDLSLVGVYEGAFAQDGDTFVNMKGLSTDITEVEALLD